MLLPLIISAELSQQTQAITFSEPAGQALQIIQALATKAGERLTVGGAIREETLLINVQGVPLSTLKIKIAYTMRAEWQPLEHGGFILQRSSKMEQDLADQEFARRLALMKRSQEKEAQKALGQTWDANKSMSLVRQMAEAYKEPDSNPQRIQVSYDLRQQVPFQRFLSRFAIDLPAEELVRIPVDEQVAFSNHPKPGQHPFPPELNDAVEILLSEQDVLLNTPGKPDNVTDLWFAPLLAPPDLRSKCGRFVVYVNHFIPQLYSLWGEALDEKGEELTNAFLPLPVWNEESVERTGRLKAALKLTDIQLPPLEMDFMRKGMRTSAPVTASLIPKELEQRLEKPEKYDPLGLGIGRVLATVAQENGRQLVAVLPDASDQWFWVMRGNKISIPALAMRLARDYDFAVDDQWITGRPVDPLGELATKGNRAALGDYVRKLLATGGDSLTDIAALHFNQPTCAMSGFESRELTYLHNTGHATDWTDLASDYFLWFYGSLTPAQRGALDAIGVLRCSDLTEDQLHVIWKALYHSGDFGSAYGDPSEALSEGIPPDTMLTVSNEGDKVVEGFRADGTSEHMTAGELGARLAIVDRKRPGWDPPSQTYKRWRLESRRSTVFRFVFPKENITATALRIPEYIAVADDVPSLDQLPNSFLDQVHAKQRELQSVSENELIKQWNILRSR